MRQALTNALANAMQASPEGMKPEARVSRENGLSVSRFAISDPVFRQARRSEYFRRFNTTRTTGTGLGLAVAQRVAEMHDGAITARTHPDGGAEFRIEIPANADGKHARFRDAHRVPRLSICYLQLNAMAGSTAAARGGECRDAR